MKNFFVLTNTYKVFLFISLALVYSVSGFSQCSLDVEKTDVSCFGGSNGTATASVTGTGSTSNNCATPDTPNEDCSSGIQVANNDNDIVAGSGQKYVINFNGFNRKITLNGGTVLICGTAIPSAVEVWSGGTLTITGTATFSNFTLCGTCTLNNYGNITFNGGTAFGGAFTNNGTVHFYTGGQTVSNWSGSTIVNKGHMEVHDASLENNSAFTNSGTLAVYGSLTNNGASFVNNCTISVGQNLSFNYTSPLVFKNKGKITVAGTTNVNNTIQTEAGSEIVTTNLVLNQGVYGAGSSCSSIKANGQTQVYTSNLTGQIAICAPNGISPNNSSGVADKFNCDCTLNNTSSCSYSWSNGATTASISGLSAGTYTVTVNCSGCSAMTESVTINEPSVPFTATGTITNPTCEGNSNGSITTTISGGTTPYSFSWSNGATDQNLTNLEVGSYTLTVTDDNNCSAVYTGELTAPPVKTPSVNLSQSPVSPQCDGTSITFTIVNLNTTIDTYAWFINGVQEQGANSSSFTSGALNNGDVVYLEATSSESCLTSSTFTSPNITMNIQPPVTPSVSISQNPSSGACFGFPLTLTAVSSNLGTSNTFDWYVNEVLQTSHQTDFTSNSFSDEDRVKVTVTSNAPCLTLQTFTSEEVELNIQMVKSKPVLEITSNDDLPVVNGTSVTFTADYSNAGNNPSIVWFKNGVLQAGATSVNYTTTISTNDVVYYTLTPDPSECVEPGTKISPSAVNINVISYAGLKEQLNATVYNTIKGKLYVLYFEKYQSGLLAYKILDKTNNSVVTGSANPVSKNVSDNYFILDLDSSPLVEGQTYILEVSNDKNKRSYLRFKFKR